MVHEKRRSICHCRAGRIDSFGRGYSDRRQRRHGTGRVGEVEVGVGVHRQANVAVSHKLLGHAGRDAAAGQQRGEGVPQAVHVHSPQSLLPRRLQPLGKVVADVCQAIPSSVSQWALWVAYIVDWANHTEFAFTKSKSSSIIAKAKHTQVSAAP